MDRKQLLDVADVLTNLVRNVHLRRELSATRADPHLVFWRLIYGDLSDITVLEWCKLFGSDDDDHQPYIGKMLSSIQPNFARTCSRDCRYTKVSGGHIGAK